jgi:hypothetical protein
LARQSASKHRADPQQVGVQRGEAVEHGDRHQEVAPSVADQSFDLALVVAAARAAEPILEQVMPLQLAEGPRALPLAVAENARNGNLGVVVVMCRSALCGGALSWRSATTKTKLMPISA